MNHAESGAATDFFNSLLAHAMVIRGTEEALGIDGYPAERGLYLTILEPFGVHRCDTNRWRFCDPDESERGRSLQPAWNVATEAKTIRLDELYRIWANPPFGIKQGVMPILALAHLLAHRSSTAVYVEGVFQAQLDEVFVDRLLQDPTQIEFKRIERSRRHVAFTRALAQLLSEAGDAIEAEALPVASRLYQRFKGLPAWTQRTQSLTEPVRRTRDVILKASDPEALLFKDLMDVLEAHPEPAVAVYSALSDCEAAFPKMLAELRCTLADLLGVDRETYEGLGLRALNVAGVTADLRFDAFAMRAGAFESGEGDIEGLASLLVHKPAKAWTDREQQQALFEMAKLSRQFREAEALAAIKGRDPMVQAISVIVGLDPKTPPLLRTIEVTAQERRLADGLADRLLATMKGERAPKTIEFAALARVLERLSAERSEAA